MKIAQVKFSLWDRTYDFAAGDLDLKPGDQVIVKTELGTEIGQVVGWKESAENDIDEVSENISPENDNSQNKIQKEIKPIIRKASPMDLEKITGREEKAEAIKYCRTMVAKHELPMKLVDVNFSFDGSRLTFAFIADGRVDFRELVKDLTRHFNRSIRLHQIGIRDEAKIMGDYGHCGRILCCKKFLNNLTSITSEMAEKQQVVHRGSERISGICGRLICCLAYEEGAYEELAQNMPAIGTKVNVDGKRGVIVGHHILKQSVDVEFPGDKGEGNTIVEVDLNRRK